MEKLIEKNLVELSDSARARVNAWFFKTGEGQYGYGDRFLGVRLPQIRAVIKNYAQKSTPRDAVDLLKSPWHEVRLAGCILLAQLHLKAVKSKDEKMQNAVFKAYLDNTDRINNWDLVDVSARDVVGVYLLRRDRRLLASLARSKNLWERRIAIVASWAFIKNKEHKDTFELCEILLKDKEDLMHKACGWMLREVGKSCGLKTLNQFLDEHCLKMPRTMLRYSLEKHPEPERKKYMALKAPIQAV